MELESILLPGMLAEAPVGAEVLIEVNFSMDTLGGTPRNLSHSAPEP